MKVFPAQSMQCKNCQGWKRCTYASFNHSCNQFHCSIMSRFCCTSTGNLGFTTPVVYFILTLSILPQWICPSWSWS